MRHYSTVFVWILLLGCAMLRVRLDCRVRFTIFTWFLQGQPHHDKLENYACPWLWTEISSQMEYFKRMKEHYSRMHHVDRGLSTHCGFSSESLTHLWLQIPNRSKLELPVCLWKSRNMDTRLHAVQIPAGTCQWCSAERQNNARPYLLCKTKNPVH